MNGSGGYACMIDGGFDVSYCVGLRRSLTQQVAMIGEGNGVWILCGVRGQWKIKEI